MAEEKRSNDMFSFQSYPISFFQFFLEDEPREQKETFHGFYFLSGFSAKLVHRTLLNNNFEQTDDLTKCNLVIGSKENETTQSQLHLYQRMSHYMYTIHLGTKYGLHQTLSIFANRNHFFPSFYPKSYFIPNDLSEFQSNFSKDSPYILKPARGSCGRGISIVSTFPNSFVSPYIIAQKYITNPMLINGYKFDLRFYVSVTSIDPLRIYIYNNGLVRLATEPYEQNKNDFSKLTAHLTNFSLNRKSESFQTTNDISNDGQGNKWSHHPFWPFLSSHGFDCNKIRNNIDDLIVTVIIAACPELRRQKNHRCSFELYAFDILLDENGNVYLLEVNISPALGTSSQLDKFIKEPLVKDWFNITLIPVTEKNKKDNVKSIERVFYGENRELASFLAIYELELADQRCGDFRRIFPTKERLNMKKWFDCTDLDEALFQWIQFDDNQKKSYYEKNIDHFLELREENNNHYNNNYIYQYCLLN